jgi:serine/threonine protein kinase
MFESAVKGSPLRLIDFGSGTMSSDEEVVEDSSPVPCEQANGDVLSMFTTFAGSAFYISPEMFRRTYTSKTDVWSAGVTIYVLVAGYPSKELQDAFSQLQNSKSPNERIEQLKVLPNMPEMPDTFYEMLEKALTYRHKKRMDAKALLNCEFIKFHTDHNGEEGVLLNRTESSVVAGAAFKHIQMRLYAQYERSISSLIASMLSRSNLQKLMGKIDELIASSPEKHLEVQYIGGDIGKTPEELEQAANKKRLQIVRVRELQSIMQELGFHDV